MTQQHTCSLDMERSSYLTAAFNGIADIMRGHLTRHPEDLNYCRLYGEGVLILAIRGGRPDAVRFLIENGIKLDITSHDRGHTPVRTAIIKEQPQILQMLLEAGALYHESDRTYGPRRNECQHILDIWEEKLRVIEAARLRAEEKARKEGEEQEFYAARAEQLRAGRTRRFRITKN